MTEFSRTILDWAEDPKGGGSPTWRGQTRDVILSHNPECRSLRDVWLPREGGVSCPSDLFECEGCGVTFFNESSYSDWDIEDYGWFCDCCFRKKEGI